MATLTFDQRQTRRTNFDGDAFKYTGYEKDKYPDVYWDPVGGQWITIPATEIQQDPSLPHMPTSFNWDIYQDLTTQWMAIPSGQREKAVWNPRSGHWVRRTSFGTPPNWLADLDRDLAEVEAARSRMTPAEYQRARNLVFDRYFGQGAAA
jgi:hypothetical protein